MLGIKDSKILLLSVFSVIALSALVLFFTFAILEKDSSHDVEVSRWIGKPVFRYDVENLYPGEDRIVSSTRTGRVFAVNFFASWCIPCRAEHPLLEKLELDTVGIAWKDKRENAINFLKETGNPYDEVGWDSSGENAVGFGILGIPETYIINKNGVVVYHKAGPISPEIVRNEINPLVKKIK